MASRRKLPFMQIKRLGLVSGGLLAALATAVWLAETALSWPARAAMPALPGGAETEDLHAKAKVEYENEVLNFFAETLR